MTVSEETVMSGELYHEPDPALLKAMLPRMEQVRLYNLTPCTEEGLVERRNMLSDMFAEVGDSCYIEPPLFSNWGCSHTHFGSGIYANFNLTLVDDAEIFVGDGTMFGPNVTLCTAAHPVDARLRAYGVEYNLPIHIGKNCWIGASAIVLPGVTIGDDSVIGAGSVVTKDIPAGVVAFGSPCRVQREIGARDREFYHADMRIGDTFLKEDIYDRGDR